MSKSKASEVVNVVPLNRHGHLAIPGHPCAGCGKTDCATEPHRKAVLHQATGIRLGSVTRCQDQSNVWYESHHRGLTDWHDTETEAVSALVAATVDTNGRVQL